MKRYICRLSIAPFVLALAVAWLGAWVAPPGQQALAAAPGYIGMPQAFDDQTVASLIMNIDKPGNAVALRAGYFGRRTRQSCPTSRGLEMLKSAVNGEVPGTRRWFMLEAMIGYAGYMVGPDTRDEGGAAYDAVFTETPAVKAAGSYDVAEHAIYDFTHLVTFQYGTRAQAGLHQSKQEILDALIQYLALLKDNQAPPYVIPWSQAIRETYSSHEAATLVGRAIADARFPRSFLLYETAASVLAASNDGAALRMLALAKPHLSTASSAQQSDFFAQDVAALLACNRQTDALAAQEECVQKTGRGRARLLLLCWQNHDSGRLRDTLATLCAPGCDENEVQGASVALDYIQRRYGDAAAQADDEALLRAYLSPHRQRKRELELWARLTLGSLYISDGNDAAARLVLTLPPGPSSAASDQAAFYALKIDRLLSSLPKAAPASSDGGKSQ